MTVARLPLACELAGRPELWHHPAAVAHPDAGTVWSVSPAAADEGIVEGQRLSEAVGRCPSLVVFEARPAHYEATNEAMLDALERTAPEVESAGLGAAYVDLAGLDRSYGGVERLHAVLLGCAPQELRPRLGVGPTKFVALLAATQVPGCGARVIGDDEVAGFVASVPVEALPVPAEMVRRLRLVDITTVGELARLPRRALVAQFGAEGSRLAGLLDGVAEPVRPRPQVERLRERLVLSEPLASKPAVLAAAEHVLGRVLRHPRLGDRVARQIVVRAVTEQGKSWESTITLREPRGDREGMWVALAPVLERAVLPGPVGELSIELRELCPRRGWQGELLTSSHSARAARRERVEESLRQLQARYGQCLVGRMAPVEPWNRIPERRWAFVELD